MKSDLKCKEENPLLDYLPVALPNLENLSDVTTINLRFHLQERSTHDFVDQAEISICLLGVIPHYLP